MLVGCCPPTDSNPRERKASLSARPLRYCFKSRATVSQLGKLTRVHPRSPPPPQTACRKKLTKRRERRRRRSVCAEKRIRQKRKEKRSSTCKISRSFDLYMLQKLLQTGRGWVNRGLSQFQTYSIHHSTVDYCTNIVFIIIIINYNINVAVFTTFNFHHVAFLCQFASFFCNCKTKVFWRHFHKKKTISLSLSLSIYIYIIYIIFI